ncbi:MAG: NAD(P)(+) transhydrogenase (Re/Si-specific) subunit alpha, partial [Candidatus Brocadiia bacterium]
MGIPVEVHPGETRVPVIPQTVEHLVKLGAEVEIESGLGVKCFFTDQDYSTAGAKISSDRKGLVASSDIVLRLRKPPVEEIAWQKKNSLHISYLDPFNEKELLDKFIEHNVNAVSMELIPRTTLA